MDLLNFVEDDAGGLRDSEDADSRAEDGHEQENQIIGAGQQKDIVVSDAVGRVCGVLRLARGLGSSWRRGTLAPSRAGSRHYEENIARSSLYRIESSRVARR